MPEWSRDEIRDTTPEVPTRHAPRERRKSQGKIARPRHQFQNSGGDDAERAFGADEQLAEAVSGVVFAQAPEAVPDASIRQNDLQSKHLIARIAVAKGVVSSGVGGQNSANLRRAFRGHGQRQHAILSDGRFLRRLESNAGLDGHRQVHGVQFPDSVHPRKRQHKLSAVRAGRSADHHAGIAALGTIAMRLSAHSLTTDATSSTFAGRTTAKVRPL